MKYAIDIYVFCDDQDTIDALIAACPGKDDPRIWPEKYDGPTQSVDMETGYKVLGEKAGIRVGKVPVLRGVTYELPKGVRYFRIVKKKPVE